MNARLKVSKKKTVIKMRAWEHGSLTSERLFSRIVSDADWLDLTGNVLITFGQISYVNGTSVSRQVRITEVTHDEPADGNRNDGCDDEPQTTAPTRGDSAFSELVYLIPSGSPPFFEPTAFQTISETFSETNLLLPSANNTTFPRNGPNC